MMTLAQKNLLVCVLLVLGICLVFAPVRNAGFINLDDGDYVRDNPPVLAGLTGPSVQWAFTTGHAANWHPVTWLSHMLDVELFGVNPSGHHVMNVGYHAANAVLLFLLLRRLTGQLWLSALVAAFFALHPQRAESVAWISERKDVLSTFFGLLCLLAYSRYARSASTLNPQPSTALPLSAFRFLTSSSYWLAFLFLALGLMSKPMLVTWPLLMLLLDYWPLRRIELSSLNSQRSTLWRLVFEKMPFFVLTVASSLVTLLVQQRGGAVASLGNHPLPDRLANATLSYLRYLGKTFWPADLAVYYPPPPQWPGATIIFAAVILLLITFVCLRYARQHQYLLVGWGWFVITLIPVIGIVQVGGQAMADRYTYVPAIGLFLVVVWGGAELRPRYRAISIGVALLALGASGILLQRYVSLWKNSETLFTHTIAVTPPNYMARFNLANALIDQGRINEGLAELRLCLEINPRFPDAYGRLAVLATGHSQFKEAVAYYRQALEFRPDRPEALNNLAWLLATCADATIRDGQQAITLALRACELTGFQKTIYLGTLAAAYAEAGQFDAAISTGLQAQANALKFGEIELAKRNAQLVEEYRNGRPYREALPPPVN
jgi:tetratricopeptide (TPR) repeat protein